MSINQADITTDHQEQEIHLRDYLRVIRKRQTVIYTFAGIIFAVTLLVTLATSPLYRAETQLLIERNEPQGLMTNVGATRYDPQFIATQFELIKSINVIKRVITMLGLDKSYRSEFIDDDQKKTYFGTVKEQVGAAIHDTLNFFKKDTLGESASSVSDPNKKTDADLIAEMISKKITIKQRMDTNVVDISYMHKNAELATMVLNALSKAYMDEVQEIRMHTANYTIAWMTTKANEEKQKLQESEKALQDYTKEHNIVTIDNRITITPEQLTDYSAQFSKAKAQLEKDQEAYLQVTRAGVSTEDLESLPGIVANNALKEIRAQITLVDQKISELAKKFGIKHPMMINAHEERKIFVKKKNEELQRIVDGIKKDYELSQANVRNIEKLLDKTKGETMDLNERFVQYSILNREVETNRILYDALMKNIKEKSVTEQTQTVNIWVVANAKTPEVPATPNTKRNIMLGLILGAFGGIGLAFFVEYLDNTIKSSEEVERRYDLTVLGMVELLAAKDGDVIKTVIDKPQSSIAESYKIIQSALLLSSADAPPKRIHITSMLPGEGKSTTVVNLARTLARAGFSVMVLDADMRRPTIHKLFGVETTNGLSTYLAGTDTSQITFHTPENNIHCIPAGPVPPMPSELLSSPRMASLLQSMEAEYDFVLIDSPPVINVTDSMILSKLVQGTLIVVKANTTTYDQMDAGVKRLLNIQAHLLGVVLNGVDTKKGGYYYSQGYAYSSYYNSDTSEQA